MNSLKSLKNAFGKKKKESNPTIKPTSPTSSSYNDNTKPELSLHSNVSSVTQPDISPAEDDVIHPLPALPAAFSGSSSIMDLSRLAQPQTSSTTTSGYDTPRPSTPGVPSNPQLHADSPLITTQYVDAQSSDNHDNRPTESDIRGPQTADSDQGQQGDGDPSLLRSAALPPSYNSLNISNNMHAASAPSPISTHSGVQSVASAVHENNNSPAPTNVSVPYVSPPVAVSPVPSMPSPLQQPMYRQPYITPSSNSPWAGAQQSYAPPPSGTQQSYAPPPSGTQQSYAPPPSGTQHYGHRPFVPPTNNAHQTYPIIMAIDWGTTYSSMAYAFQQDGEVHEVST
ncbi:hypothetical protein BGZ46_003368, partial [Entomortierella lignicola]